MNNRKQYIAPHMETVDIADETMLFDASENITLWGDDGIGIVGDVYSFDDIFPTQG